MKYYKARLNDATAHGYGGRGHERGQRPEQHGQAQHRLAAVPRGRPSPKDLRAEVEMYQVIFSTTSIPK